MEASAPISVVLLVLALGLGGCLHDSRPATDRGAGEILQNTQEVTAPLANRCEKARDSGARKPCEAAHYSGEKYVQALSPGEDVCLENIFGDPPGRSCLARAKVADVSTGRVLLHVANPDPTSRWYKYVGTEVWFQEGALVDLYLEERGY